MTGLRIGLKDDGKHKGERMPFFFFFFFFLFFDVGGRGEWRVRGERVEANVKWREPMLCKFTICRILISRLSKPFQLTFAAATAAPSIVG
jgi:hypothetical protein